MKNKRDDYRKSKQDIKDEIYDVMTNLYHEVAKVDLETGCVLILCSSMEPKIGTTHNWDDYLKNYVDQFIIPSERLRTIHNFCTEELKKKFAAGENLFSCDVTSYITEDIKRPVTIMAFKSERNQATQCAYILVRNADCDYLLHSIVNQYVYDNCDYFIYLDAKNNSYTMFSGHADTPLPPAVCMDYESALIEYAENFVVEEDREMVMREMHLPRVIEQIEKNEIHSFTCGVMENEKRYTRKKLEYRYHDREKQMILLSRTDITKVYLEEEKKRMELEKLLVKAQTDPLTKLLNFRATIDKITECLENGGCYALYFIDLDNFKSINDTYGHLIGDDVICSIAESLKTIKGKNDIVGRVGGDEFVFFSKVDENKEQIKEIADKICNAIRSVKMKDVKEHVTGSVGIAIAPEDGSDYYTLVTKADKGLYNAKKLGKNKYSF